MHRILPILFCMLPTIVGVCDQSLSAAQRPNILLILADDMGYGDMSYLGSQAVSTPHLDALIQEGVLCTQAYVTSSVCSPSRAGLITGRDPRRFGYEGNLNAAAENYTSRPDLLGLPIEEHTLGDHLRALDYSTALIGKWHLGSAEQFHPNRRGFDYFCGMLNGGHDYFPTPDKNHLQRNGKPLRSFSTPYLTDFFTEDAIRWITKASAVESSNPWFLFLSYNAPHTPMQATEEDLAACQHVKNKKRRTYAAMMLALDRGIGRVVQSLEQLDQRNNTLVVFLSDNGGATNNSSWNGPLSGAKGSLREGGVRVPMIWTWPGHLAHRRVDDFVVSSLDLLPTFTAAAGGEPLPLADPPSYQDKRNVRRGNKSWGPYDGIDLLPTLQGKDEERDRKMFWRLQGQAAVRSGDLKLIRPSHRPAQLFHVNQDRAEQNDLSTEAPKQLESLFADLANWEAILPTVPIWDSSPYWSGDSAKIYDSWPPKKEPQ